MIEELKRRRSSSLHGSSEPLQDLESSTQSCHSHRKRRARPNLSRSGTPNPPMSFGLVTIFQLTRQWPPFAFSSPFHKKDLLILSIFFLAQAARGNTVRWYVGMEDRTEVTRVRRPALFSSLPFHLGSLCPIRSMRGCTWILCSVLKCS